MAQANRLAAQMGVLERTAALVARVREERSQARQLDLATFCELRERNPLADAPSSARHVPTFLLLA